MAPELVIVFHLAGEIHRMITHLLRPAETAQKSVCRTASRSGLQVRGDYALCHLRLTTQQAWGNDIDRTVNHVHHNTDRRTVDVGERDRVAAGQAREFDGVIAGLGMRDFVVEDNDRTHSGRNDRSRRLPVDVNAGLYARFDCKPWVRAHNERQQQPRGCSDELWVTRPIHSLPSSSSCSRSWPEW